MEISVKPREELWFYSGMGGGQEGGGGAGGAVKGHLINLW